MAMIEPAADAELADRELMSALANRGPAARFRSRPLKP